eukprot:scaffold6495_cov73-Cylindrotheca_fusiformis.AAC.2
MERLVGLGVPFLHLGSWHAKGLLYKTMRTMIASFISYLFEFGVEHAVEPRKKYDMGHGSVGLTLARNLCIAMNWITMGPESVPFTESV